MSNKTNAQLIALTNLLTDMVGEIKSQNQLLTELLSTTVKEGKHSIPSVTPSQEFLGYDWNIYAPNDSEVRVTAYKRVRDWFGDLGTDYDKYLTLTLDAGVARDYARTQLGKANWRAIAYLLDNHTSWHTESIEDYDDWVSEELLLNPQAGVRVNEFVKTINQMDYDAFDKVHKTIQLEKSLYQF
jgi:hypothetical protein